MGGLASGLGLVHLVAVDLLACVARLPWRIVTGMLPQWIIEKKRDGGVLTDAEIRSFIAGYTAGTIPDYQAAALAMAIYFQGMTTAETSTLTDAMMRSGEVLDFGGWPQPTADKHSTGGIGDKVSLILAPLVACAGITVPMLSGRGLGITGGTLDKLEAIPGYRTDLTTDDFRRVLRTCGCSITGQTASLAPADKKLYALRDVTGTVPSIPLIAASIMSKKLAEGAATLVLDVKWGTGAFMQARDKAVDLARTMVRIGNGLGRHTVALITDMNQPLGRTAGNAVEICETVAALQGRGPEDLMAVTMACAAEMLAGAGRTASAAAAHALLQGYIDSGEAHARFCRMVTLQGGDAATVQDEAALMPAGAPVEIPATGAGTVSAVDAGRIGCAVLLLGGGRQRVEDRINPAVGITGLVKIGETVTTGQPLMSVWAPADDRREAALELLREAVRIGGAALPPAPLISGRIDADGEEALS